MVSKRLKPVSSNKGGEKKGLQPRRQGVVAPTEKEYVDSLLQGALSGQRLQVMTFLVDDREYSFEVSDAVEVIKPRPVTAVPRTPDFLLGILSVRGEMVPVVDLRRRFGAPEAVDLPLARVLVVSVEDMKAGFLVDRMTGVEEVEKRAIRPPDRTRDDGSFPVEFIKGVIELKNRRVILLNIRSLLEFASMESAPGD